MKCVFLPIFEEEMTYLANLHLMIHFTFICLIPVSHLQIEYPTFIYFLAIEK